VVGPDQQDAIVLQVEEIRSHRWATPEEASRLLSGPVGRRIDQALAARRSGVDTVYLEDGRPVPGVSA
jgi:hypothetical protein